MTNYLLHLLRHGEPEQTGRFMGRTDCAPTAAGIAACVDQVGDIEIEALLSSDLSRSAHAARAIAHAEGVPATIDARWRELDFGEWDGLSSSEIDGDALGRFWDDPDANPPPQGERWSSLTDRVGRAIGDLAPRSTLVVTHGGAMRAALSLLCGFDQRQIWAFDLPYASLLTLKVWPGDKPSAQIIGLWP